MKFLHSKEDKHQPVDMEKVITFELEKIHHGVWAIIFTCIDGVKVIWAFDEKDNALRYAENCYYAIKKEVSCSLTYTRS